jgi:hypothetical protein
MRCKCCDQPLGDTYPLYRTVQTETGREMKIMEDMCPRCKSQCFLDDEDDLGLCNILNTGQEDGR